MKFHRRCGDRVTLLNENTTAVRNFVEFNHGLILSAEPLINDVLFEIRIDRKVNVWNGSLEIGVTTLEPDYMELPATATKLRSTAWIMSGSSIVKDGVTLVNCYGPELDTLREGDSLAVVRSSKADLLFYINGQCLGIAARDLPLRVFAVIDLYGQCVQVSVIQHANVLGPIMETSFDQTLELLLAIPGSTQNQAIEEDPNNDDTLTSSEMDVAGLPVEPYPKETPNIYVPMTSNAACALVAQDHLRFHPRCGILVKLSANNKCAERARPLDDYNNGVVMTHRPLYDNELFEIRIDTLVDKWSGSIEVGVTTHNPATIRFPSTMTNMDSGTIMMSGCKVLLNGHGTCMEYGNFNLDELREGDTVGMIRKSSGKLHYFINGVDQGVAADKVQHQVWGVVDLYGMTVKVSIIDPCEDMDSNINNMPHGMLMTPESPGPSTFTSRIDEDSLLFHTLRDSNVIIINDGKTAHRPNAFEFFNNGIVMTNRTLKTNELFQVRLDLVIPKWAGSIEIGVTQHSSNEIQFPFKMSNAKTGTWAITGEDVIRDGTIIIPQYVRNLNRLVEGDTVGVMRKNMGILHFFVNGVDQGPAAFNIPEHVFGIVDLYGRVAQATIVDTYMPPPVYTPESPLSSESNATIYPEMCFHRIHGRNARLSRNRLTASRATVYSEFNDAVLFSSRPLRECDMFELRIDKMVDCWIGSLEIGVTAIRPDDLEVTGGVGAIAGTATDLNWDTYILSGAAMMKDGECVRSGYPLDLDTLTVGSRIGMMWHADRSLHYYLDGMDMGKAWYVPHLNIYAVIDLYGQCTQVTILQNEERAFNYNGCTSDNSMMNHLRTVPSPPPPYWSFSEYCGDNIILMRDYSIARRRHADPTAALVFSSAHLALGEIFEIKIAECKHGYAGSFRMGITDINILNAYVNRSLPQKISCLPHFTAYIDGRYMKYSRAGNTRAQDIYSFVPSFEWLRPGDRVGLKKTSDSKVLVYYNSEQLEEAFEKVPDKVYVIMEMYGNVTKIEAVSRNSNIPNTLNQLTIPNDDCTMPSIQTSNIAVEENACSSSATNDVQPDTNAQSNLTPQEAAAALVLEIPNMNEPQKLPNEPQKPPNEPQKSPNEPQKPPNEPEDKDLIKEEACAAAEVPEANETINTAPTESNTVSNEVVPTEPRRRRPLPYTFHRVHGENIRLCSSDTVALRFKGYTKSIAISSQPLKRGQHFRFRVDKVDPEWHGGPIIGAVGLLPTEPLPDSALHLEGPVWVVSTDILYICGAFSMTEMALMMEVLHEQSVLSLHFRFNSELVLEVNGIILGTIATIPQIYSHVFPTIELYGRVCQISILLHPHLVVNSGNSLDLPIITENLYGETLAEVEVTEDDNPQTSSAAPTIYRGARPKQKIRKYSQGNLNEDLIEPIDVQPGPSRMPDMPMQASSSDVPKNIEVKCKKVSHHKISLHQSLIVMENIPTDDQTANRRIKKSHSTHNFRQTTDENLLESEVKKSLRHTLSEGSRVGTEPTDGVVVEERTCDTNIRHNDRYPEASDVDNLDNEIMDALTLETGNLPDLTEEQSSSIDESTRRDDFWSESLSIEDLNYLNLILSLDGEGAEGYSLESEWEASGAGCEHLHLVLKFWNYLVQPFPELRQAVSWGQVHCYCSNCQPEAPLPLAGWVRIERIDGIGASQCAFWHIIRSTLGSAQAVSTENRTARRPRSLASAPSASSPCADIWFDEEGKPHHTVLAIEIDVEGSDAENDRLLAFLIYLKPHAMFPDDNSSSLEE